MANGWLPSPQINAPLHFGVNRMGSGHDHPYRSVG